MRTIRAPPAPKTGMKFWVQTGTHWSMGVSYTVGRVNSRSFYIRHSGRCDRFLLVEWTHWLHNRVREGILHLDFVPVQLLAPLPGEPPMADIKIDIRARDQRFLRAATNVLQNYALDRSDDGDLVRIKVTGGKQPYQLEISKAWNFAPGCSCPDASHRAQEQTAGFCKHIIAALIINEDLRCQLLDVIL
jgi:hypothetical protein